MSVSRRLKSEGETRRRARQQEKRTKKGRGNGQLERRTRPERRDKFNLLIVCEGSVTEPRYFEAFPKKRTVNVLVRGTGRNTLSLVDWALELRRKEGADETWVVMDRDSFEPEQFRAAIQKARAHGLHVAYTNEAFEAWYLMHFHYCDADLSRETYKERLSKALGRPYVKNDPSMYWALHPMQTDAIRNAKTLQAFHAPDHDPEADNPSTTVHLLVQRLNALR